MRGHQFQRLMPGEVGREGGSRTEGATVKISSMPFGNEHNLFISLNKQAGRRAGLPERGISVSSASFCFSYFAPGFIVHGKVKQL